MRKQIVDPFENNSIDGSQMKQKSKKKLDLFPLINGAIMIFLVFCFILPFWLILVTSFSEYSKVRISGTSLSFQGFTLEAYKYIFTYNSGLFLHSLWISFLTSFVSAAIATLVCTLAGYSLSKKYLPGRKGINIFLMITMFFSGGTIPLYLVIRGIGLYNTIWALILPGAVSAYNILLVRNYFYTVPKSLEEAAYVDGANDMKVLRKVYVPLALPIMVTIFLMNFVAKWNSWLPSLLYVETTNDSLWTVQYVLRKILTEANLLGSDAPITTAQNAAIVIVVLPLVILTPILQKYYQKGLTSGADKG